MSVLSLSLFEVAYAGQENLLILVARNIAEQARSKALAVAHLAEDTSVGAGDAFDSIQAAVRVERSVHGRYALSIYILGSNLAVSEQLFDSAFRSVEAAFAVRYGNCMLFAGLAQAKPRRFVGNNSGGNNLGNMTADVVEGQCRCIAGHVADIAVRNEAELNQCLEAVADT